MKTIVPFGDMVVIRPVAASESVSAAGIVLAAAKNEYREGVVVARGPGAFLQGGARNQIDADVGDHVLYETGTPYVVAGVKYELVYDNAIKAKLVET